MADTTVHTAGPPARITLTPDRARIAADGQDLSFVTVRIEDAEGRLCPVADNMVRFSVSGAGAIAAVDNGDPATTAPFHAGQRAAFNGLALLIVRGRRGQAGAVHIEASSPNLTTGLARVVTSVD